LSDAVGNARITKNKVNEIFVSLNTDALNSHFSKEKKRNSKGHKGHKIYNKSLRNQEF
jgi:hypothetical protein